MQRIDDTKYCCRSQTKMNDQQAPTGLVALVSGPSFHQFGELKLLRPMEQAPQCHNSEDNVTEHAGQSADSNPTSQAGNPKQLADTAQEVEISGLGQQKHQQLPALLASKRHVLYRRRHPERCSCSYHTAIWAETCALYVHRTDRIQCGKCECRFCDWVQVLGPVDLQKEALDAWIRERGGEETMSKPVHMMEDLWMLCWERLNKKEEKKDGRCLRILGIES